MLGAGAAGRACAAIGAGLGARVALAEPRVLLLDEPLSGLDPALRSEVRNAILDIASQQDAAMIVVSHDLEEAGQPGDRVAVLIDGAFAQVGTPRDVFARPATLAIARFLGVANLVRATIAHGDVRSPFGNFSSPLPAGYEGPAVVAFRTDAVRIDGESPVRGRVRRCRHGVDRTTVLVELDGGEVTLRVEPGCVPAIDTCVGVRVDLQRVLVYPVVGGEGSGSA